MITDFSWKISDHITILYYHSYSCGKFLSNIISFNDNFVPQMALTEKVKRYCRDIEVLHSKEIFDKEIEDQLREYKITNIFKTIPPDQSLCLDWYNYELGCQLFWNFNADNIDQPGIIDNVHENCIRLLYNKKYCFIVAHDQTSLQKLKKYFPNAQIIELINDAEIWRASVKLKNNNKISYCPNPKQLDSIKFEIGSLFDRQEFFKNIENLLTRFDINDRRLDQRVFDFYEKYVSLYHGYI